VPDRHGRFPKGSRSTVLDGATLRPSTSWDAAEWEFRRTPMAERGQGARHQSAADLGAAHDAARTGTSRAADRRISPSELRRAARGSRLERLAARVSRVSELRGEPTPDGRPRQARRSRDARKQFQGRFTVVGRAQAGASDPLKPPDVVGEHVPAADRLRVGGRHGEVRGRRKRARTRSSASRTQARRGRGKKHLPAGMTRRIRGRTFARGRQPRIHLEGPVRFWAPTPRARSSGTGPGYTFGRTYAT